jgi:hypothetical protein
VLAIFNFSRDEKLQISISHPSLGGAYSNLFSGIQYKLGTEQNFELQAWQYIVLYK